MFWEAGWIAARSIQRKWNCCRCRLQVGYALSFHQREAEYVRMIREHVAAEVRRG